MNQSYVGRFAPTPSGGLHFGSLVTALASYLDAKAVDGQWLVRIEDIDPPREVSGAKEHILFTLEAYGLEWDREVFYQSKRFSDYEAVIEKLLHSGLAYPCACSRKELEAYPTYPNFCRDALLTPCCGKTAIRIRVPELVYQFNDGVQGVFSQNVGKEVGDFVIQRKEGLYAYQLAVVLDDAEQGVTHVVRGADLLSSTPRQLYLQELLGIATPHYLHVPVMLNQEGTKLSKSLSSHDISLGQASLLLVKALGILGQELPNYLEKESVQDILQWAINHWRTENIPKRLMTIYTE